MEKTDGAALHVQARLLSDPPLWSWEIVEASSGSVVASSWQSEWTAYTSPDEALREGAPALARLTGRRGLDRAGAMLPRRLTARDSRATGTLDLLHS